ncbi:hypothetical protein AVEN_85842-1 [Araneus ventricosus]|uniref:Uncharacterized protein n=1 Tax=Araneus ventricosus TaxID=182803 RepID=A0A4Y2GXM1_ARAVE|nr:hypothetical protein AVEN_85842-1 [Araneus ventricosus]
MTRTTTELAPPSPNFHATPTGGRLTTTYDLTCNRPHTRRIFSGGFEPGALRPQSRDLTTRPPRPGMNAEEYEEPHRFQKEENGTSDNGNKNHDASVVAAEMMGKVKWRTKDGLLDSCQVVQSAEIKGKEEFN